MARPAGSPATWLLALAGAFALVVSGAVPAQVEQHTVLVAKPRLVDPNFRETVVVVANAPNGATVGVIINRPTAKSLAQILPGNAMLEKFTEPLFFGGPVERVGVYAIFRAAEPPGEALHIAGDLWLALNPATVEQLMRNPPAQLRFFTGYSGWAPGQLAAELGRGDWWTVKVDPDVAFRADPSTLWEELARRTRAVTAAR